jgi:uncharacterized protein (TIGR02996 family)
MAAHDGFLREIVEHPDDDTPRLVYADWLDDHGDPDRAEFIRLQIDLARKPKTDPNREVWQKRERELLDVHAWEWAADVGGRVTEWVFRRGFLYKVQTSLETSAEEIRELLRLAPIRHIRDINQFCKLEPVVEALPALSGLVGLEFWNLYAFDDALIRQLLTSPHLANLRTLIVAHDRNGNLVEDAALIEALGLPYRANLRWLEVNVDGMWRGPSEEVLLSMIASPYLKRVRKLNLSETMLTTELFQGLLRAMPRLERINFHETKAPIAVWEMVLERARQGKLKWLCLCDARIVESSNEDDYGRDLTDDRRFRRGSFKPLGVKVDWYSELIDPYNGGCWEGHTWDALRQRHVLAMGPFVASGDWDGLATTYRADCVRLAGESMAARIDALPFAQFEADLRPAFEAALQSLASHPLARCLYLEMEYGGRHPCKFVEAEDDVTDKAFPFESAWGLKQVAETPGPAFPGVDEIEGLRDWSQPLDPGSGNHYLLARVLGLVARLLRQHPVPVPFVLRWERAHFRL